MYLYCHAELDSASIYAWIEALNCLPERP